MACVYKNGIIEMTRGDTFTFPVYINVGSKLHPMLYELRGCDSGKHGDLDNFTDNLYFAVMEPNQTWENAIIRKTFDYKDFDRKHMCVLVHFFSEDTEYLKPGVYYYQVKLRRDAQSLDGELEAVDTIIGKTKFIILD